MFNVGTGEIAVIAVVALLVLGPQRLPELARGIGKFLREFRRQTDEVRTVVEREFYRMDQEVPLDPPPAIKPAAHLAQGQTAEEFVSRAAARVQVAPATPPPAPTQPPAQPEPAPLVVQSEPSQITRGADRPEAPAVAPAPADPKPSA